jgi:hypothetical protein
MEAAEPSQPLSYLESTFFAHPFSQTVGASSGAGLLARKHDQKHKNGLLCLGETLQKLSGFEIIIEGSTLA